MNVDTPEYSEEFKSKGFLQTAFTDEEIQKIITTNVDNSAESTNPDGEPKCLNNGINEYTCDNTKDKIFLLSLKEAINASYGFQKDDEVDAIRDKELTDFSWANGAYPPSHTWWLRSPYYNESYPYVHAIYDYKDTISSWQLDDNGMSVVPALCIE